VIAGLASRRMGGVGLSHEEKAPASKGGQEIRRYARVSVLDVEAELVVVSGRWLAGGTERRDDRRDLPTAARGSLHGMYVRHDSGRV
jgi:hypothetical protein